MKTKFILPFLCIVALGISSCSQREDVMSASDNLPKSRSEGIVLDYPPADAMANHYIVIDAMEMAWQQMKNRVTNGNGRAEYGFYIRYLFEQNTLRTSPITEGPVITNCAESASLFIPIHPADTLTVCGIFHCHTSLEKCPPNFSRVTGPSISDLNMASRTNLPFLLYDYVGPEIVGGHSTNDPYKLYTFGLTVRPETILNP